MYKKVLSCVLIALTFCSNNRAMKNEKDFSEWDDFDKKKLKLSETYHKIVFLDQRREKITTLKDHINCSVEKKQGWETQRLIYAAGLLAGARPIENDYIYEALKQNDGKFIDFIAKKSSILIQYVYNIELHAKTGAMIELLESYEVGLHYGSLLNLISECFKKDRNWNLLGYCLNRWQVYPNRNFIYEWLQMSTKDLPATPSELYNALKKLQLLSIKGVKPKCINGAFKKSHSLLDRHNLIILYLSLISPNFHLPMYLELYGDDYGDFPERKVFGQNIDNPNFFDCTIFCLKRRYKE